MRYFVQILSIVFFLSFGVCVNAAADSLEWTYSYEDALALAKSEGKPIMAGFYTTWCGYCAKLDSVTYVDSKVIAASKGYVCLKVDTGKRRDVAYMYGISSVPAIVFMDPAGRIIWREFGYRDPEFLAKRMQEVLEFYTKSLAIEPYIAKAFDEANRGQIDQALDILGKGVAAYPKDARLYAARSVLYRLKKDIDAALRDLDMALSLNPTDDIVFTMRGITHYEKKDFDKAMDDFNKAISINRRNYEGHNGRGVIYLERNNLESAIKSFNAALIINPRYAGAYFHRGIAYMKTGVPDKAIADFSRAIELQSDLLDAYLNRAAAYMNTRQYDKSWEDIHFIERRGVSINPEFMAELRLLSKREQ